MPVDDLESDIRAAQESVGAVAPTPEAVFVEIPSTPIAEPEAAPKPEGERARDETGKFKAKDAIEAPKADAAVTTEAPKPADVAAQKAETVPDIAPPLNWKGAGKVDWKRLPKAIQQEITQDYTRSTETQAKLQKLETVIGGERGQQLSATYGSVEQGLQNLFAISDMATKNPQGFLLWFAQQRGVNLAQMVGQASQQQEGQQQQPNPAQQADPIAQRLSQLETMIQGFAQQTQQASQAPVLSEIDRFASDPAHPYWNDVQDDIKALLQGGRVQGSSPTEKLQNAYDMAVWAHPEIRKTLIESQQKNFVSQQAEVAKQALNASSSISGSPAGAKIANQEPDETLEQTIIRAQKMHLGS